MFKKKVKPNQLMIGKKIYTIEPTNIDVISKIGAKSNELLKAISGYEGVSKNPEKIGELATKVIQTSIDLLDIIFIDNDSGSKIWEHCNNDFHKIILITNDAKILYNKLLKESNESLQKAITKGN